MYRHARTPFLHHLLATIICVALFAYPSLTKAEQCGDLPVCGTEVRAGIRCTQNPPKCCIRKSLGVFQNFLCSCTPGACSAPIVNGPFVTSPVCTDMWQCSAEEVKGDTITPPSKTIEDPKPVMPDFNTPIPGFGTPTDGGLLLASYISAIYRYGLSIGIIAATVMFIWGGFVYLIGSSGAGSIAKGRSIMEDAVIGLILLFSANLILRTLNPSLTIMRSLSVIDIKTELLDNYVPEGPMGDGAVIGGDSASGDFVPVSQIPRPEMAKAIIEGAKLAGVDPCIMLAICEHETGLRSIWNGYLAKRPKSSAIAFGACQVVAKNLRADNPITHMAKQLFPDFPNVTSGGLSRPDQLRIGDWLLSNPKGGAFVGGMIFKAALRTTAGNELTAVAAYGAGTGSMQSWRRANNCSPTPGAKIATSGANDLTSACVPHVVAIPKLGAPPGGCPEDKYVCSDAKADASAQFTGHCSDGRKCYAMVTDSFVKYVLGAYPKMKSMYQCDQK